jgi:hypothetical protein
MKYKITKGLITQKLDNKTVIFDGERSVLYTFNETASCIFQKLKQSWEKERIINQLIKKYNVKKEKAEKDLSELISKLIQKK